MKLDYLELRIIVKIDKKAYNTENVSRVETCQHILTPVKTHAIFVCSTLMPEKRVTHVFSMCCEKCHVKHATVGHACDMSPVESGRTSHFMDTAGRPRTEHTACD